MTGLLEWIKRMIFLGIFLTIFMQIIPSGTYRKYVRFFAGMVFVLTVAGSLFSVLGENNWEQILEQEVLQDAVLKSGELDFSYMERQQQKYYEEQTQEMVVEMIKGAGEVNKIPVQQVQVMLDDAGAISQVTVWTSVTAKTSQQKLKELTAQSCGIGENQVEVYTGS